MIIKPLPASEIECPTCGATAKFDGWGKDDLGSYSKFVCPNCSEEDGEPDTDRQEA